MPDPNKLDALTLAGFTIKEICGLCKHATFKGGSDWGTCSKIPYEHGKHTGATRAASIHKAGHCRSFAANPASQADLARSGFDRFVMPELEPPA